MKQALVEGAVRLPGLNIYEQGQGKLDVGRSKEVLANYQPR
jgi:membrane-bound transcription factor site-1 protease